jgi:hypothetical protein
VQVGRLPADTCVANSSIRYRNEAEQVRRYGGHMIRILRGEPDPFVDLDHPSEREWETMPVDFEVHNDGTEADLERKMREIIEGLSD